MHLFYFIKVSLYTQYIGYKNLNILKIMKSKDDVYFLM